MHPTEDQLLGYAIGILGEGERREVATHLETCAECRSKREEMAKDIKLLAGARMDARREYPPLPVRERWELPQWAKLAAVLMLGFVGGALASAWWRPEPVVVVPMPQIETTQVTAGTSAVPGDALQTRKL